MRIFSKINSINSITSSLTYTPKILKVGLRSASLSKVECTFLFF